MIIETLKGDLLTLFKENKFDAIGHGCNCFHLMSAGIARQIANEFPEAYKIDTEWSKKGDFTKLGLFSPVKTEYGDIYNFYTQYEPGANFEYGSLINGLLILEEMIMRHRDLETFTLGLPMIGAGIGGGNWDIIKDILDKSDIRIIVVEYDKGETNMGQTEINFTS